MTRAHELSVNELVRGQRGLVTVADLARVTGRADEARRRMRTGRWQRVLPGVLAPATSEVTPELLAAAAMLWEPAALLSHHAAAQRQGIWVPEMDRLRVTVPFRNPRRSVAGVEVFRTRVFPERFPTDGFLRWTPPARTLVDLGMCLSRRQLEAVLVGAVRAGRTSAAEVEAVAASMPGRAGLAVVRAVTALWTPQRESLLEDRLHGAVASATDEVVTRQHEVRDVAGDLVARLDVAVVALRLGFEADGLCFHSTDEQIAADQARDRRLLRYGWQTVRFREDALRNPAAVRAEVASLVRRRRQDQRAA
ncbi:MAG TPA: hypothetical protein VMZ11_01250 [Mycobacteriales bacterium]|nr:hypothetical protein [Mycobacteriales bacterium]